MLTDSIVRKMQRGLAEDVVAQLCLKVWYMPPENWIDVQTYRAQLERHGFRVDFIKPIGHKVFPGFAAFNTRRDSIRKTLKVRGFPVGMGLVFICWLLGYVYERGLSDYLIVRAVKIS